MTAAGSAVVRTAIGMDLGGASAPRETNWDYSGSAPQQKAYRGSGPGAPRETNWGYTGTAHSKVNPLAMGNQQCNANGDPDNRGRDGPGSDNYN